MLKKIGWGIACLWVVFMSVSVVTLTTNAQQSKAKSPGAQRTQFLNGFPWDPGWKEGSIKPPLLTTEQLVTRDKTLQELADKAEITNLLYAYGFYHDTGNGPGIISTFTKDGAIGGGWNNDGNSIDGDGCMTVGERMWNAGVDSAGRVARWPDKTVPRPFPGHSHNIITNVMIQLHGDTAELHAYYTRVHANVVGEPPVAPAPLTAAVHHTGEYIMDLRRTPEGWRFTRQWHVGDAKPENPRPPRDCPAIPTV